MVAPAADGISLRHKYVHKRSAALRLPKDEEVDGVRASVSCPEISRRAEQSRSGNSVMVLRQRRGCAPSSSSPSVALMKNGRVTSKASTTNSAGTASRRSQKARNLPADHHIRRRSTACQAPAEQAKTKSIMDKIDNVYGLTENQVFEYRNLLLNKMTFRQLRILLSMTDGCPVKKLPVTDRVQCNPARKYRKAMKHGKSLPGTLTRASSLSAPSPYFADSLDSESVDVERPRTPAPISSGIYFACMAIGKFRITSPRVNSAEANELRVCASTNRLMYLVQFELERNWYKAIYSTDFLKIDAIHISGLAFIFDLNSQPNIEVSYCNNQYYQPDIAASEILKSRRHIIDLKNEADVEQLRSDLISAHPSFRRIMVDRPASTASRSGSLLSINQNEDGARPSIDDRHSKPCVTGSHNPPVPRRVPSDFATLLRPLLSPPTAQELSFTSPYLQHGYQSQTDGLSNVQFANSGELGHYSGMSGDVIIPTQSLTPIMSTYAEESCQHDSQYASLLQEAHQFVESQYYVRSMEGNSYYADQQASEPSNSLQVLQFSDSFTAQSGVESDRGQTNRLPSIMELYRGSNTLMNVPMYSDSPINSLQSTSQFDTLDQIGQPEHWGAGSSQLGGPRFPEAIVKEEKVDEDGTRINPDSNLVQINQ